MAKKTTYCCDRCGKEFSKIGFTRFLFFPRKLTSFLWHDDRCISEIEFDLCADCSHAFGDFIRNNEVMPNGN